MHEKVGILFSGGSDSLSLYALAATGSHPKLAQVREVHLMCMQNGMTRFDGFPETRYRVARRILEKQLGDRPDLPASEYVELDVGRLFQGLWLDRYEQWMPRYGGKNLVCVACKLSMHTRAILYCKQRSITSLMAGYAAKQAYYPEQTPVFMNKMADFSLRFGIETSYPLYDEFDSDTISRHLLEDFGLPSTGGGERKCLFCQTVTTAGEKEIGAFVDDMIPRLIVYLENKLKGGIKAAAECFPVSVGD